MSLLLCLFETHTFFNGPVRGIKESSYTNTLMEHWLLHTTVVLKYTVPSMKQFRIFPII